MTQQTEWLPPAPPQEPPPQPIFEERKSLRQKITAALVAIGAAIAKFFAAIKTAILFLPKIKILATSGTMLVSIAAYGAIWGLWFGVGFVILLLIHEMGHVIQLRREGIKASAPLFIPFLGAFVGMKEMPENALAEARVGLAGPLLGSVAAAVCLLVYGITHRDYWRALAFAGFFLNLLNLLPMLPLDGGRAMAAMSPWMWFAGLAGLVVLLFVAPNPILLLIVVFGGIEMFRRWRQRDGEYYKVPPAARIGVALVYIGLIAALGYGMHVSHIVRHFSDA